MYEQVGRRKLGYDPFRHGRFTIIVEQRNYGLYKAKTKDALLGVLIFSYSVQDTMTVIHFWLCFMRQIFKEKPKKSII